MQDVLFSHFSSTPDLISVVSFINTIRLSLKLYPSFFFLLQSSEFPVFVYFRVTYPLTPQLYTQVS